MFAEDPQKRSLTREGVNVRTVQRGLASAAQCNTDGNKTWYHFLIRRKCAS
ncbi:hypothetical protein [Morganella morganii]|uniref:hypothetical protein n=1 Tax=Morganella morganii TaxID=582 RepID=UPI000B2C37CE|nr:hypothetical protein [Morganella morganii]